MNTKATIEHYRNIKNEHAPLRKCFFAFSESQFYEGKREAGIGDDEKIYSGEAGLYGTKEGIQEMFDFYDAKRKQIAAECNPQDVYNYEWSNYECMVACDDEEAIRLVVGYFGMEIAKTVKRKYAYTKIEDLV